MLFNVKFDGNVVVWADNDEQAVREAIGFLHECPAIAVDISSAQIRSDKDIPHQWNDTDEPYGGTRAATIRELLDEQKRNEEIKREKTKLNDAIKFSEKTLKELRQRLVDLEIQESGSIAPAKE